MAEVHSSIFNAKESRAVYKAIKIIESKIKEKPVLLSSPEAVRDYLRLLLANEEREVFLVMFLDSQNRLIETEKMFYGTICQTSVYPREVVKLALHHNAVSVIFAHNHPGGNDEPSDADKSITNTLKWSLNLIDVETLDHFIVAENNVSSFRELGLM